MNVAIYTLGCKVNQFESDKILEEFIKKGHKEVADGELPDIVLINTCAVTNEAEKKSRQICRKAYKVNPCSRVFVFGCSVENYLKRSNNTEFAGATIVGGALNKEKIVDNVLQLMCINNYNNKKDTSSLALNNDNNAIDNIPNNVVNKSNQAINTATSGNDLKLHKKTHTREYIKIQDGCELVCSYCIIPSLRGASISVPLEQIIVSINNSRAKEIVLTGINISSWGNKNGQSLNDLFKAIDFKTTKHSDVPELNRRIRLGSLEQGIIDIELLELMKQKNFCNHFHLSMQSGTNSVLQHMRRRYTIEEFINKVQLIRQIFGASVGITTDIITGYPTEGEEDFLTTLENLEKIKFSDMHIFRYSSKAGTVAGLLKPLDSSTVASRLAQLEGVRQKYKNAFLDSLIGTCQNVLFETLDQDGYTKGYTSNYCLVKSKNTQINTIRKVVIKHRVDDILFGECL